MALSGKALLSLSPEKKNICILRTLVSLSEVIAKEQAWPLLYAVTSY